MSIFVKTRSHQVACSALVVALVLVATGQSNPLSLERASFQDTNELWQQVQTLIQTGEPYSAVELMATQGGSLEVAEAYNLVARSLYRDKDLAAYIVIVQSGIEFCLSRAVEAERSDDSDLELALRGWAKTMSREFSSGPMTWLSDSRRPG